MDIPRTDSLPDDDIARQRDEVVKRMLATPPQPRPKPEKKPKA
jgi:hypothetical protein